jgi:hypothetical protein
MSFGDGYGRPEARIFKLAAIVFERRRRKPTKDLQFPHVNLTTVQQAMRWIEVNGDIASQVVW